MKYLFWFLFIYAVHASANPVDTAGGLKKLMDSLTSRGQFNGSILVAINGKVIFRNGYGESNVETHEKFTPATISCLASVSKQFTAMAIMMLAEENKCKYDDPASLYLHELPEYARAVTIRQLLTHTSGFPDVGDLGIDHPGLTNGEVLKTVVNRDSLAFKSGAKYQYSNTGYILLAIIVERITGHSFKDYLTGKILTPLKMSNTFLVDGSGGKIANAAVGYNQFGNIDGYTSFTTGDGGMYSTVDDLEKWEEALYSGKLVKPTTLDIAFTAATVTEGRTTYGFGWNITGSNDDKVVWHTGNTAGFRAFIERRLRERVSIIMLTNKGNSRRMEINDAIVNILKGSPYEMPAVPICTKLYKEINEKGINAALDLYDSLKASKGIKYDFSESELNTLGYQLLSENKKAEALEIFKLNTISYPNSSNAFDGLGDAYVEVRKKDSAISSYQRAIDLDKNNVQSLDKLTNLKRTSNGLRLAIAFVMIAVILILVWRMVGAKLAGRS